MAGDDSKGKDVVQPRVPQPWENNPYHELYLHHSDQTGGALIPILLEEDNYQSWQEAIQDALDVKNKTGFLDGTLERPEADGEERQQWQRCNTMVKHWLLGSMSKTMHKSVARMKDAKSIWDELKERFTQTGCLSMIQIEEALNKVDQGSSTVNAYYTRLKTLWDERDALIVYPTCKCNLTQECHCEAAGRKVLQSFLETNKTMKFLLGLNGSFAQTRNNITAFEPIMPLNKVLAMVLRHEKQDVIVADKQTPVSVEASAFAAKIVAKKGGSDNGGKQGSSEYGGRYCEKCKETTHSTKYYRAHITCTYCGGKGHSIDYCRTKKRREGQGGSSMTPKANAVVKQPDFSGFRLSTKECDNMLGLISKIREASLFPLESDSTPIPLSLDSSNPPNPHNDVAPSPSPIITPSFPRSPPSSDTHSLSDFSDDSSGPTSTNIPIQPHSNPTTTQNIPHPIPSSPAPLPPPSPPLPPPRRSTRATRPPPKLDQFHVETHLPSRSSPSSSSNVLSYHSYP
ncbi:hypothetical protein ACLB2K_024946 [Fragaria x ananassa]